MPLTENHQHLVFKVKYTPQVLAGNPKSCSRFTQTFLGVSLGTGIPDRHDLFETSTESLESLKSESRATTFTLISH